MISAKLNFLLIQETLTIICLIILIILFMIVQGILLQIMGLVILSFSLEKVMDGIIVYSVPGGYLLQIH